VLQLDRWAVICLFFLDGIWSYTIDTWPFNTGDCLGEVTAWPFLTVYTFVCTIYTRLDTYFILSQMWPLNTCLTVLNIIIWQRSSSAIFNILYRMMRNLDFYIADVVEWSRALDIRRSDWCCSVSMVWDQIPSRKNKQLTAQRINTSAI
jgi:hypothetical protein